MSDAATMERRALEAREDEQEFCLDLVERARRGDRDAFAKLAELYQKRIFRLAYSFFHDRDDALEIVQETFMRAYEKIGSYQPDRPLQGWLYRLAYNLCVDYYRKFNKRKRLHDDFDAVAGRYACEGESGQELCESRQTAAAIERALSSLSQRQREVFTLKYRQGMKLQQVAETMAVSLGTVKALHHRALQRIRREVAPGMGGEHGCLS
jgi:RNA polymerase sigma-70 factor (ECF subfamily)